jgi:hypothetical protein
LFCYLIRLPRSEQTGPLGNETVHEAAVEEVTGVDTEVEEDMRHTGLVDGKSSLSPSSGKFGY